MNLPLSAFNSPFPLSTSKTIAFLETSEREERQWTHVYEKYRDVCRAMLEKRYPEWTMYAEDAVSAAFAKIARNNKTPLVLPNNNKPHHPCKLKRMRTCPLHLQRRRLYYKGFTKDQGLKSLFRAFQKEKCNVPMLHVKYFLNLLQL